MNKSFLITGGAGYIGTALSRRLLDQGAQITVFDNLITGRRDLVDPRARFVMGDVLSYVDLSLLCATNNFDTIIHLAALKSVGDSETAPRDFMNVNVSGTLNILEMMKEYQIYSLVFSSTAAVYKENSTGVYDEDCALSPMSIYGSTKLICEELIRQYERLGHIRQGLIFRYFNLAGDSGLNFFDRFAQNVFPMIARACLDNHAFSIFGDDFPTPDGTGIRDYIHLNDLVEAHVLGMNQNMTGVFNLGTQDGTSVMDLVERFNNQLTVPLKVQVVARRPGDVAKAIANPSKAKRAFNWVAKSSIDEMVKSTIKAYHVK